METIQLDLGPQAAAVTRVVAGIRDDQLGDPTPCADTPVAGLLAHLAGLATAFRMAAEKTPVPGGPSASDDDLPPDMLASPRPSASWMSAACATTPSSSPPVSTATWRLRPFSRSAPSQPRGPPLSVVFTLRVSTIAAVGLASRPAP